MSLCRKSYHSFCGGASLTVTPKTELEKAGKFVLIDGASLLYRAWFALPPMSTASGEPTNAVYGFATMLFKLLETENPTHIAVAFDLPAPTFRHRIYEEYKATRPTTPDGIISQGPLARELIAALRIPVFDVEGFEADDVIATLARRARKEGHHVLIVTGDLDTLQLVEQGISVLATRRGISDTVVYDEAAVMKRFGLRPEQLPDYRALRGDPSDNLAGVPGIGEKTASQLLQQSGDLESLLASLDGLSNRRLAATLETYAEQARQTKQLSLLVDRVPLEVDWELCRRQPFDADRLSELFRRLEFRSLFRYLEMPVTVEQAVTPSKVLESEADAAELRKALAGASALDLILLSSAGPAMSAEFLGLGLAAPGAGSYLLPAQAHAAVWDAAKQALASGNIHRIIHDYKRALVLLRRRGLELNGVDFDAMIASHLLDPSKKTRLEDIAFDQLGTAPLTVARDDEAALSLLSGHALASLTALKPVLEKRLEEAGLARLLREVELPFARVLADMEYEGVGLDSGHLAGLSGEMARRIADLEKEIHILAGEPFLISSPQQLRRILFEKLALPPDKTKKTKTGYSTDADVLNRLAEEYEIVRKILEYRELTKLKATYVDVLPCLVNPATGRLHSSFDQTGTATGRLSSSEPNLQNIPIRTELGREIRRAFVPSRAEDLLLSADYSQIELRLLAHISGCEQLAEVFRKDEDLHTATACELFNVEPDGVTKELRSFAKMVNFGIPYGISDFRLARELGTSVQEARRYMDRYFARFPGVAEWIKRVVAEARENGYVTTLFGRRRPLGDLRSSVRPSREAAERAAINTPIQGSAADLIKLAMVHVQARLRAQRLRAKLILQVHDELLLEVPKEEVSAAAKLMREAMAETFALTVPLKVELSAGPNWRDMHPLDTHGM